MTYFEDKNFHATQKSGKKTIIRGGLKLNIERFSSAASGIVLNG